MRRKIILIFGIFILLVLIIKVIGYTTYGAPAEFGNESDTTCFIGGDFGVVNCTGNFTGKNYLNSSGGLEWIKPENVYDIDKEDIENDLNTFVDIGGDRMAEGSELAGVNLTGNTSFGSNMFIDNTSNRITITSKLDVIDDANVTGNLTGNIIYGEMHFHSDQAAGHVVTITTKNVWVNITGFNGTPSDVDETHIFTNGFTFINKSNALRCDIDGRYSSWYKMSTGNAGNNEEYETMLSVADVRQEITTDHRKIGAGGDVGSLSGGGSFICYSGDIINLQSKDNDGTADLNVHVVTVIIQRIGDIFT